MKFNLLGETGLKVSQIGIGGGPFGSLYGEIGLKEVKDTVFKAIDSGINFFDTAPAYGDNLSEQRLGKALAQLDRSQFILSTKTGKYASDEFDYSYDRIIREVDRSLARLQVEYVDILSLHDFEFQDGIHRHRALSEGLDALRELKKQGKTRYIGTAIYFVDWTIEAIESNDLDTVICHNHHCLHDDRINQLLPVAKRRGVGVIGASPMGMGLLTENGPAPWHPIGNQELAHFRRAVEICSNAGTKVERLAIQHTLGYIDVPVTLVGVKNPAELGQILNWSTQEADPELVKEVQNALREVWNKDWLVG